MVMSFEILLFSLITLFDSTKEILNLIAPLPQGAAILLCSTKRIPENALDEDVY